MRLALTNAEFCLALLCYGQQCKVIWAAYNGARASYQPLSNMRNTRAMNVFLYFRKSLGAQATFAQHAP